MKEDVSNTKNEKTTLSDKYRNGSEPHHIVRKRNFVLDKIRETAPISVSELRRKIIESGEKISYGLLWEIIRQFEFCRLVFTKTILDENNTELKIIHVQTPEEEFNHQMQEIGINVEGDKNE